MCQTWAYPSWAPAIGSFEACSKYKVLSMRAGGLRVLHSALNLNVICLKCVYGRHISRYKPILWAWVRSNSNSKMVVVIIVCWWNDLMCPKTLLTFRRIGNTYHMAMEYVPFHITNAHSLGIGFKFLGK
jgi:hypothetical protein